MHYPRSRHDQIVRVPKHGEAQASQQARFKRRRVLYRCRGLVVDGARSGGSLGTAICRLEQGRLPRPEAAQESKGVLQKPVGLVRGDVRHLNAGNREPPSYSVIAHGDADSSWRHNSGRASCYVRSVSPLRLVSPTDRCPPVRPDCILIVLTYFIYWASANYLPDHIRQIAGRARYYLQGVGEA